MHTAEVWDGQNNLTLENPLEGYDRFYEVQQLVLFPVLEPELHFLS